MTTLLLLALLGTAWGQDTVNLPEPTWPDNPMFGKWVPGRFVKAPPCTTIHGTDTTISRVVAIKHEWSDSLCATCGDTCRVVQVDWERMGDMEYPTYARRCPQHGRHVEWIGTLVTASWVMSPLYHIRAKEGVELGLREDGTCVWRRKESK